MLMKAINIIIYVLVACLVSVGIIMGLMNAGLLEISFLQSVFPPRLALPTLWGVTASILLLIKFTVNEKQDLKVVKRDLLMTNVIFCISAISIHTSAAAFSSGYTKISITLWVITIAVFILRFNIEKILASDAKKVKN